MEVIDAEEVKKKRKTKVWKYDEFVEAIKRIAEKAGDREELGLKIDMSEIMQYLLDNRKDVQKFAIRSFIKTAAKRAGFKLEACLIKDNTIWLLLKRDTV
ncbi:MAG: hypothetical protein QXM23_04760 [Archaeoglobaceae archaeon]